MIGLADGAETPSRRTALVWHWAWLMVLATWLILAHGCHGGDHDDELAVMPFGDRTTGR